MRKQKRRGEGGVVPSLLAGEVRLEVATVDDGRADCQGHAPDHRDHQERQVPPLAEPGQDARVLDGSVTVQS